MSCNCNGHSNNEFDFQYSSKLICGTFNTKHLFTPGIYRTVVNVHNPSRCDEATFLWKVVMANHVDSKQAKISEYFESKLGPDGTCFIDCEYAIKKAGMPPTTAFDGWLVIESSSEFDVETVHTVQPSSGEGASSISTERVCARLLPQCLSGKLDLSTGVAAWEIINANGSTSRPHMVDLDPARQHTPGNTPDPQNAWAFSQGWHDLPGSLWLYDGNRGDKNSVREYQLNFDLKFCGTYKQTEHTLDIVCDDLSLVELNGSPLVGGNGAANPYQVVGPGAGPCTLTIPAGLFVNGMNTLTVKVKSLGGYSGFSLHCIPEFESAFCESPNIPRLPCPTIEFDTYCNKKNIKHEHWSSNGGSWFPASTSLQCCPNAILSLDSIKKFRVQITNASSLPGVHVKYEALVSQKIGSSNMIDGPVYDGADCGKGANNWAINWIKVGFLNAPIGCSVYYQVERSKNHSIQPIGMNYLAAGDKGWSIHCMAIWT